MSINANFNLNDLKQYITGRVAGVEAAIVNVLSDVGEQAVSYARTVQTYHDQTGNLRSSTGYAVAKQGAIIDKPEAQIIPGPQGGGAQGAQNATEKLDFESSGLSGSSYSLVVVAAMEYAPYVEAKGLDVLTGAWLSAKQYMNTAIAELRNQIRGK